MLEWGKKKMIPVVDNWFNPGVPGESKRALKDHNDDQDTLDNIDSLDTKNIDEGSLTIDGFVLHLRKERASLAVQRSCDAITRWISAWFGEPINECANKPPTMRKDDLDDLDKDD